MFRLTPKSTVVVALGLAITANSCASEPQTWDYEHVGPDFRLQIPEGLTAAKDQFEAGGNVSISIHDESHEKEVFVSWNNLAPPEHVLAAFDRHREHPDLESIVAERELPNGGRFIHIVRGEAELTFVHAVVVAGPVAVECTVANPKEPSDALLNACATLAAR